MGRIVFRNNVVEDEVWGDSVLPTLPWGYEIEEGNVKKEVKYIPPNYMAYYKFLRGELETDFLDNISGIQAYYPVDTSLGIEINPTINLVFSDITDDGFDELMCSDEYGNGYYFTFDMDDFKLRNIYSFSTDYDFCFHPTVNSTVAQTGYIEDDGRYSKMPASVDFVYVYYMSNTGDISKLVELKRDMHKSNDYKYYVNGDEVSEEEWMAQRKKYYGDDLRCEWLSHELYSEFEFTDTEKLGMEINNNNRFYYKDKETYGYFNPEINPINADFEESSIELGFVNDQMDIEENEEYYEEAY